MSEIKNITPQVMPNTSEKIKEERRRTWKKRAFRQLYGEDPY